MKVLDLFSGIGGFSLGLERTGGFETVAFCEIEEYPRKVLAKHWPDVPCYTDVRELSGERLRKDGISVDVITGGFPCQDISRAGKGAGIEGERSGLWSEIARLAGDIRPRYIILENVSALLSRGLDKVLGDLAEIGYDAEWHCIPASAIGAPHQRDRWWCVGYPSQQFGNGGDPEPEFSRPLQGLRESGRASSGHTLAHAKGQRLQRWAVCWGSEPTLARLRESCRSKHGIWGSEPNVGRVANGVSKRVDRLKGLGNAVVPQIPELIGRVILEFEDENKQDI